jgi:hypothetical protein
VIRVPIPNPILDDRSYQQLRDELVQRIPVYMPEWTDHNATDPGITLIELFAFLGENLLYRFNQIPEVTRIAFLNLLQIPRLPATPSRAIAVLTGSNPAGTLAARYSELKAGNLSFETRTEAVVWPVEIVGAARAQQAPPDAAAEPEVNEFALRAIDALGGLAAGEEAVYYTTRTVTNKPNDPPVDFDATVDGMLWVGVLNAGGADVEQLAGGLLNIGISPDLTALPASLTEACPGAGNLAKPPAVEWQISTGRLDNAGAPVYIKVASEGDTTRGLTQEGVVRLRFPRESADIGLFPADDEDLKGTAGRPPVLDDEAEAKLLFWLRAFRPDGSRFGKLRLIAGNAVEATQTKRGGPEFLGAGTAQPNQVFRLAHSPVLAGSQVVEVEEAGQWKSWTAVEGFHASAPDDRHYVLDSDSGQVRFGNSLAGMPPQIGQRIRAVEYRYGGGAAGNVPAEGISRIVLKGGGNVKVSNPLPAWGGGDAETLENALDRIPGELRRRDRAVTPGDFKELALLTPGANVGRAECLPLFHPPTSTENRAGIVSVIVWPQEDPVNPSAPTPTRNVLRAVCEWLDMRRLVTTELYVIPPVYRKVAVAVGLAVKPGFGVEAVRRWVELVIRQYLAPLPPYGPAGQGWPLGRRVHGPELEAAALQVEGVEFLEDLKVAGWNESTNQWTPGTVELRAWEVAELAEITVVEGPPLEPGKALEPPASPNVPVPIPILREEC